MCSECDKKKAMMQSLVKSKYQQGGSISKMGYKDTSPYNKASSLMINSPTGSITMDGVSKDLIGTDEFGNTQYMRANSGNYQFQGTQITEVPIKQQGGQLTTGIKPLDSILQSPLGKLGGIDKNPVILGMKMFNKENNLDSEGKMKLLGNWGADVAKTGLAVGGMAMGGVGGQAISGMGNVIPQGQEVYQNTGNQQPMQTYNTTGLAMAKNGTKLNSSITYLDYLKKGGSIKNKLINYR